MSKAVRVVRPDPEGWSGWLNAKSGENPGLVRLDWAVGANKNFWAVIARNVPTAVVRSYRLREGFSPELSTCPDHPDQPSISAAFQRHPAWTAEPLHSDRPDHFWALWWQTLITPFYTVAIDALLVEPEGRAL
jgi:hypothetical protein